MSQQRITLFFPRLSSESKSPKKRCHFLELPYKVWIRPPISGSSIDQFEGSSSNISRSRYDIWNHNRYEQIQHAQKTSADYWALWSMGHSTSHTTTRSLRSVPGHSRWSQQNSLFWESSRDNSNSPSKLKGIRTFQRQNYSPNAVSGRQTQSCLVLQHLLWQQGAQMWEWLQQLSM